MSYSYLNAHTYISIDHKDVEYNNEYDKFIFEQLQKGPHIGDMLHNIFEYVDFSDNTKWDRVVKNSLYNFLPNKAKDQDYQSGLKNMIEEVVNANISFENNTFSLSEIDNLKRKSELEFDFRQHLERKNKIIKVDEAKIVITNKKVRFRRIIGKILCKYLIEVEDH